MLADEQKSALESTIGSASDDVIVLGGDTITLDLGNMAGAQSCYSYSNTLSGISTITLNSTDPTVSYSTGSAYNFSPCYTTSSWNSYSTNPSVCIDSDGVNIKEGGDIKIGGKSLTEAIEKIEERLGILKPNPAMEDKWEELKQLGQRYRELEKELYEKEKMWEILKRDE